MDFNSISLFCFITARKRSLGQGNVFARIRHSVHWRGGSLMMSLPVCLSGPMFLLVGSVSGPMFLPGCLSPGGVQSKGVSVQGGLSPGGLGGRGVLSRRGSVQGDLCPAGDLCPGRPPLR